MGAIHAIEIYFYIVQISWIMLLCIFAKFLKFNNVRNKHDFKKFQKNFNNIVVKIKR